MHCPLAVSTQPESQVSHRKPSDVHFTQPLFSSGVRSSSTVHAAAPAAPAQGRGTSGRGSWALASRCALTLMGCGHAGKHCEHLLRRTEPAQAPPGESVRACLAGRAVRVGARRCSLQARGQCRKCAEGHSGRVFCEGCHGGEPSRGFAAPASSYQAVLTPQDQAVITWLCCGSSGVPVGSARKRLPPPAVGRQVTPAGRTDD